MLQCCDGVIRFEPNPSDDGNVRNRVGQYRVQTSVSLLDESLSIIHSGMGSVFVLKAALPVWTVNALTMKWCWNCKETIKAYQGNIESMPTKRLLITLVKNSTMTEIIPDVRTRRSCYGNLAVGGRIKDRRLRVIVVMDSRVVGRSGHVGKVRQANVNVRTFC
jgi:hypothetical protein